MHWSLSKLQRCDAIALSHARSNSKLFVRLLISCSMPLINSPTASWRGGGGRRWKRSSHRAVAATAAPTDCRPPPASATLFLAAAASTPQPTTPKTEPLLPSPSPPPPPRSPSPPVRAHVPRCEGRTGRTARRALEMKSLLASDKSMYILPNPKWAAVKLKARQGAAQTT